MCEQMYSSCGPRAPAAQPAVKRTAVAGLSRFSAQALNLHVPACVFDQEREGGGDMLCVSVWPPSPAGCETHAAPPRLVKAKPGEFSEAL